MKELNADDVSEASGGSIVRESAWQPPPLPSPPMPPMPPGTPYFTSSTGLDPSTMFNA